MFLSDVRQTEVSFFSLLICLDAKKNCMAKRPYSYRDDLSKGLFKITTQVCKKFTSD